MGHGADIPSEDLVSRANLGMMFNPYVEARREWDERYVDLVLGKRKWLMAAAGSLAVALVLAAGMVCLATRSRYVPYVVEVDKLGLALTVPQPLTASAIPHVEAPKERYEIAAFIRNGRAVSKDSKVGQPQLTSLLAHARGFADRFLDGCDHADGFTRDPFQLAEQQTVAVQIDSILQLSTHSYHVRWTETARDLSSVAASPYTVMAGNIIRAVPTNEINSDLPAPLLAQASPNVLDSVSGKYISIPPGSCLIGAYQNVNSYGQLRLAIAWQRLIFPNTTTMALPSMPSADQSGYAGLSDQVDHDNLATFGTAALISLISARQQIGQMATFGGGGTYGPYGYTQPNQFGMAGEVAGSAASNQFGSLGQQLVGNGMNRPATIEIRPGYEFAAIVSQDLASSGPYGK